jgi:uncharacterized protein YjbI with pentapeptide repeats
LSGEGRSPPAFAIQPFGQVFHTAHHTAEKNSRKMKIAVDLILIPAEIYIMHNGRWMMSNIQIRSRLSGAVIFEAEIAAKYDGLPYSVRLGLAAKMAHESGADLSGSDLRGTNLSRANLSGANLSGSDLSGASLSGTNLRGTNLSRANLSGSDLRGTNLSRANLSRAYLRGSNLSGADLSGSDLSGSSLRGASLSGSDLSGSNLSGASLRGASLSGSDLSRSNLSRADLSRADLSGASLSGASLLGAKIISVIARTTRMDGHEFIGFLTDKGIIIRAGCRTMSPAEYRAHVAKEYPREDKAAETLAIIDYIEARAAQVEQ